MPKYQMILEVEFDAKDDTDAKNRVGWFLSELIIEDTSARCFGVDDIEFGKHLKLRELLTPPVMKDIPLT